MKHNWDKKYFYWGLTAFLVICAGLLFYYVLFHGINIKTGFQEFVKIIMPLIDGFVLAYLMTPILNFAENSILIPFFEKVLKKKKDVFSISVKKRIRALGITLTLVIVILLIYSFFAVVIPQLARSLQNVIFLLPNYVANFERWILQLLKDHSDVEQGITEIMNAYFPMVESWVNDTVLPEIENMDAMQFSDFIAQLSAFVDVAKFVSTGVIGGLVGGVINVATACWNMLIGLIISVYLLFDKEKFAAQGKKMVYSLAGLERANVTISNIRFIHNTFIGFIVGKIIDSIIIGILCYIGTSIIGTPYPILVSVIVGVTNIIPFFGPYIGAIPSALLVLMVDPVQCIYFLIFVLILQQFDGNILGPAILGESTGLSSFWVIFSITFFGGLWGVFGMIIGVPLFAIFYAGIKASMNRRLIDRNLPVDTEKYKELMKIAPDLSFVQNEKTTKKSKKENLSEDEQIGKGYSWLLIRKNKRQTEKNNEAEEDKQQ